MNPGIQNVLDADGIGVAITGMLIVFSGLVLISLYIAAMPRLLNRTPKAKVAETPQPVAKPLPESGLSDELVAAIAYVIRMETQYEDTEDHQRITIRRDATQQYWAVTGRLRTLSTRM